MTRRHAIIGIVLLISLAFSNGCRDYPDSGPLAVELQWEIPPSDDAGASDVDVPEPGTFGECEQAGVVKFDYQLEDMSDCVRYSDGWDCRPIEYGEGIPCEKELLGEKNRISGGDYRARITGRDEDGNEFWSLLCEGLYVDGSKTEDGYICDVPYISKKKDE